MNFPLAQNRNQAESQWKGEEVKAWVTWIHSKVEGCCNVYEPSQQKSNWINTGDSLRWAGCFVLVPLPCHHPAGYNHFVKWSFKWQFPCLELTQDLHKWRKQRKQTSYSSTDDLEFTCPLSMSSQLPGPTQISSKFYRECHLEYFLVTDKCSGACGQNTMPVIPQTELSATSKQKNYLSK